MKGPTLTVSVETQGLTRRFGAARAVEDLSITAHAGEVLALLGPNGAGKTTTIRLLNGVLRPDHGWSRVLGLDPSVDGDELRRRTGVLTENAGLDERLTASENLVFAARMRGIDRIEATKRAAEMLDRFGMGARANVLVQGASTGQRKRIALGRALMHEPEVLFLDEPTSGLDPAATREVLELIAKLATEGRTIVLCTHFLAEAGSLAHRMAVMHEGRLQASGPPSELAATLWEGVEAEIELLRPADPSLIGRVAALHGVGEVMATAEGLKVQVTERSLLGKVVTELVHGGAEVLAAIPREASLEDVYFEIERRLVDSAGEMVER